MNMIIAPVSGERRAGSWAFRLACLFALTIACAVAANAGDAAPVEAKPAGPATAAVVALVDTSRSSAPAAIADRIRFVVDGVLPLTAPGRTVWTVGRVPAKVDNLARTAFATRWSDYRLAFAEAFTPLKDSTGRTLVVLAGDGLMEAVYDGMPPDHLAGLPADATRDQINARLMERTAGDQAAFVRRPDVAWLLLDTAPEAETGSFIGWIAAGRKDAVRIGLGEMSLVPLLTALDRQGLRLAGRDLTGSKGDLPIASIPGGGGTASWGFVLPEGCTEATLLVNAAGNLGEWTLDIAGSAAAGWKIARTDDDGVARVIRITGCEAGGEATVKIAGARQDYEIAAVHSTRIVHTMTVLPAPGTDFLFTGDPATIQHRFTRAPGTTPVSAALAAELLKASEVRFDGKPLAKPDALMLPVTAGKADLRLVIAGPWAPLVDTKPLTIDWKRAEPLVLTGGFQREKAYDGENVGLAFAQNKTGRRTVKQATVTIGDGTRTKQVPLTLTADGALTGFVTFTADERATWTIDAKQTLQGDRETGRFATAAPASDAVRIVRNWWPLIIAGILLLLALLGLWLWWYLTRPRFRGEVFEHAGGLHPLTACPGERARDLSLGLPAFQGAAVFQAVRGATVIAKLDPSATLYVNGKAVTVGTDPLVVPPGTDIELVQGGRRAHGRFFANAEQAKAWAAEQAAIDLAKDFESEHVIIA
jgi:hypothetical protein